MKDIENQGNTDSGSGSLEDKVSRLEQRITEQQDQLRDYEKSLVERIADVDDDRRRTASQLQRAWQTQLEEVAERLALQRILVIGAMALFLVVVGLVLFFTYRQADSERQSLTDDLAGLKQELARTSANPADMDSMQAELTRLSAAVNEISAPLGLQDEKHADRPDTVLEDENAARDKAKVIDEKVQGLEAKLESLMREVETLREAQENAKATKAVPGHDLSDGSPAGQVRQDSTQEPATVTGEPPLEFSPAPPTEGLNSPQETTAAAAEQPPGDDTGKVASEANPDTATPKPLVIADDTYALQLIGFYSLDNLLTFADRNDLPQRMYYRKETVDGRPWFSLIHSLHKDYASAQAQLHDLTPKQIAMHPWIRPIDAGVELMVLEH